MAVEHNLLDTELVYLSKVTRHGANKMVRFRNYIFDIFARFTIMAILANISDILIFFDKSNLATFISISVGVLFFLYYPLLEYFYGKTLGKFLTKSSVVDINGGKITFGQAIIRSLCRFIPFEAFSFLDSTTIGWHDRISKTRVVNDSFFNES